MEVGSFSKSHVIVAVGSRLAAPAAYGVQKAEVEAHWHRLFSATSFLFLVAFS